MLLSAEVQIEARSSSAASKKKHYLRKDPLGASYLTIWGVPLLREEQFAAAPLSLE